jgi:hypothetical protein
MKPFVIHSLGMGWLLSLVTANMNWKIKPYS